MLLVLSFGFRPTSVCKSPEGIYSPPDRMGLKWQLIRWLLLTQARGREGYGMWGEPMVAEASMMLQ